MKLIVKDKKKEIKFSGTVAQLLNKLKINDQLVIVKINERIVTELDSISDKDKVEVTQVVFGG